MTPILRNRIAQIRHGQVPKGYKKTRKGTIPVQWKVCMIGDIATVSSGSTPSRTTSRYWNGEIPWVTTGELSEGCVMSTNERISHKAIEDLKLKVYPVGTLLMAMYGQGKTRGTTAVLGIDATINQACAAITVRYGLSQYLYYFLQSAYDDIRRLSNVGNQENLNADIIKTYPVILPPLAEQRKIAKILAAQDRVIELKGKLLAEKQWQKKYLMQQLLTGKKRLPGFDGKWEKVKLSEVLLERKEKNSGQNHRICSVAIKKGVVDQIEHLGRSYAAADTSNYGVAHYGDVIYTKSPSGEFPYGIVKQSQMKESVAVSPLYGIFEPVNYELGYVLHTYFGYTINCSNYLLPIIQKGAKNTINITNGVFVSNCLYLPVDYKEQKALAKVFITADREIGLLRQNLEQEERKKKALMQLLLTGIVRV